MSTLTEKAYKAMRHDIVRGALNAGQPLRMAELSTRYCMGFSPLREALSRLQAEGLVVLAPLRGFSVAALSLEEMWDTINLRILIESEALRLSIAKGGVDWEAGIVATLHALNLQSGPARSGKEQDLWELESRHQQFHMQLISACGSPRILTLAQRLYVDTERYRIPNLLQAGPSAARDVAKEHSAIAEAVLARKTQHAVDRLTEHYQMTAKAIEMRISAQPSFASSMQEAIKTPKTRKRSPAAA